MLGGVYLDISEELIEHSRAYHNKALAILENGSGGFGSEAWNEIAFYQLMEGNPEQADESLQNGLAATDSFMYLVRPALFLGQALLALARKQLPEANGKLAEARRFVEERDMRNYFPLIGLVDGRISSVGGKSDHALEQFTFAESAAEEMGMRPYVWRAQAGAAKELSATGRATEAEEKRRQAFTTIDEIAEMMADEELRAAFLLSAKSKVA